MRRVGVVIPARDEEERIGACLRSVAAAVRAARAWHAMVIVVSDRSRDRTAELARGIRGVRVIESDAGNVGAARRAGADAALAAGADWLANTDADSVVPENWLTAQLAHAAGGADVVVGTVRPRFEELPPGFEAHWRRTHAPGRPNGHVHGANLGVASAAYRRAGGFADDPEHEDTRLVDRLLLEGARVVATDDAEVVTSGRRLGRTPGGYAGHLRHEVARLDAGADARSQPR